MWLKKNDLLNGRFYFRLNEWNEYNTCLSKNDNNNEKYAIIYVNNFNIFYLNGSCLNISDVSASLRFLDITESILKILSYIRLNEIENKKGSELEFYYNNWYISDNNLIYLRTQKKYIIDILHNTELDCLERPDFLLSIDDILIEIFNKFYESYIQG